MVNEKLNESSYSNLNNKINEATGKEKPLDEIHPDTNLSKLEPVPDKDKIIPEEAPATDNLLEDFQTAASKEQIEKEEQLQEKVEQLEKEKFYDLEITSGLGDYSPFKRQTSKGITKWYYDKNEKTYEEKSLFGNLIIENVEIITDALNINEDVYNIKYHNLTNNKTIELKYQTKQEIINNFISSNCFYSKAEELNSFFRLFLICATNKGIIEAKNEAYLEGFYILNDKVVENTQIKNLKSSKEKLAEAITLLNNIMKTRSNEGKSNDAAVYRFMLYAPFSYCLKQLGYGENNYSLILIGASQANKSGAIKIANHFYNHTGEETAGSTVSVVGSKLEENSFPKVFDECSHLFNDEEAINIMKRAIYEKTGRAVKDRGNNKKIDNFKALGLPVFLLNEPQDFKDYITNRYKIISYTTNSVISKEDKKKFNKEYIPTSPYSPLKSLNIIGKSFYLVMKDVLEDKEQHKKLFDIENLITEILKEIARIAGVDFAEEMYTTTNSSAKYNFNINQAIKEILNNDFKEKTKILNHNTKNRIEQIVLESVTRNDFNFITYNRNRSERNKEKKYIISRVKLEDYFKEKIPVYVEIEQIIEALNLDSTLKTRAYEEERDYSEYLRKKQYKIITAEGKQKNIQGFWVSEEDLIYKIFSLDYDVYDYKEGLKSTDD